MTLRRRLDRLERTYPPSRPTVLERIRRVVTIVADVAYRHGDRAAARRIEAIGRKLERASAAELEALAAVLLDWVRQARQERMRGGTTP